MAYDTTEAVAKFLSGFQMKITKRERDTVAPDYYVIFSALADDALTLRKYSTDEFVDKLYAQGVKPSAALRAYDSCKETISTISQVAQTLMRDSEGLGRKRHALPCRCPP